MSRILAIDYGKKRTGIAVTDTLRITANALITIASEDLIYWLKAYCKTEPVGIILLGYPTHLDGSPNTITPKVDKIYKQLNLLFKEQEIILRDESYTSKMAFQIMIDSGMKKKARQDKSKIDQISAAIILQEYLESISLS